MPDSIRIKTDAGFTGTAADLAAFTVVSPDPVEMTKTVTDWTFDALDAAGFVSGVLPANGGTIGALGLANVANDSPLALPAALRAVVTASNTAQAGFELDANGRGGFLPGADSTKAPTVHKAGIADNLVSNPTGEGYLDFLATIWCKPNTGGRAIMGCGGNGNRLWGFGINAGGAINENMGGRALGAIAAGTWTQLAVHHAFNVGSGVITIRVFRDGVELGVAAAGSRTIAQQSALAQNLAVMRLGGNAVDPAFDGTIARADRVFTAIAGHEVDPAAYVAADYAANKSRIAGL